MFLRTLREDPADADVDSAKLLQRAGYIRKAAPGIWTWLPLGLKVLNKIEDIIREEINGIGAQEVHFPALLPREPYEATHRWEEYGDNIFRLKDRHEADYLLAPTHEEMFTLLVKDMYSSYKDLPVTLYQIQILLILRRCRRTKADGIAEIIRRQSRHNRIQIDNAQTLSTFRIKKDII